MADVKDAMLKIPENKHLARLASAAYDMNNGSVTLEYQIEGEDGSRVETVPIEYEYNSRIFPRHGREMSRRACGDADELGMTTSTGSRHARSVPL